jgi:hypothetical protein
VDETRLIRPLPLRMRYVTGMLMGIAVFLLGPATAIVVAVSAWKALRYHRVISLWPAVVAVSIEGAALWAGNRQLHYWDGWELSPMVDKSGLVGTWRRHSESVSLRADGTFVTASGRHGQWSCRSGDGAVVAGDLMWYPLKRDGELVLLPFRADCAVGEMTACSDADTWDKSSVWTRGN